VLNPRVPIPSHAHRYQSADSRPGPGPGELVVEVVGLPGTATYKDIRAFLAPAQVRQHGIHYRARDPRTGHPTGDAFVVLVSAADVDTALAKNQGTVQGCTVEVGAVRRRWDGMARR
jgi:hypothetical protein